MSGGGAAAASQIMSSAASVENAITGSFAVGFDQYNKQVEHSRQVKNDEYAKKMKNKEWRMQELLGMQLWNSNQDEIQKRRDIAQYLATKI